MTRFDDRLDSLPAGGEVEDADERVELVERIELPRIDRIRDHGVEEVFLDRWHRNYDDVQQVETEIESVDVDSFVSGVEKLLSYHLASRGSK